MNAIYDSNDIKNNNRHDFEKPTAYAGCLKMSAGIFQWELKSNGKSLKRKKVIVRVIGTKYQRLEIENKAKEICLQLDAGNYNGKKSFHV